MKALLSLLSISLLNCLSWPATAQCELAVWKSLTPQVATDSDYLHEVGRKIKAAWQSPMQRGYTLCVAPMVDSDRFILKNLPTVVIEFSIMPDGSVSGITTRESSGSPKYDAAAIESVKRAAPFSPLPIPGLASLRVQDSFNFSISRDVTQAKLVK